MAPSSLQPLLSGAGFLAPAWAAAWGPRFFHSTFPHLTFNDMAGPSWKDEFWSTFPDLATAPAPAPATAKRTPATQVHSATEPRGRSSKVPARHGHIFSPCRLLTRSQPRRHRLSAPAQLLTRYHTPRGSASLTDAATALCPNPHNFSLPEQAPSPPPVAAPAAPQAPAAPKPRGRPAAQNKAPSQTAPRQAQAQAAAALANAAPAGEQEPYSDEEWLSSEEGEFEEGTHIPERLHGRLKARAPFWREMGASNLVQSWVEEGFPLKFGEEGAPPQKAFLNHNSAHKHADFVTHAIEELLATGAVQRWTSSSEPICISPLGVAPKANGTKLRLILDMRHVNTHLVAPKFAYEGLDKVHETLEPNDWVITADLKSGYHVVAMHPSSAPYMAFRWNNITYFFSSLPFGLASAPWAFTKITRVLIKRWRTLGIPCQGYLDDFLVSAHQRARLLTVRDQHILPDFERAGFVLGLPKCHLDPAQTATFLGVELDTVAGVFRMSEDRISQQRKHVHLLLSAKRTVLVRHVAQLLGHLNFMRWSFGLYVPLMCAGLYECIRNTPMQHHVRLTQEARSDLEFWQEALGSRLNGHNRIWRRTVSHATIQTDAAGRDEVGFQGGYAGLLTLTQYAAGPAIARGVFMQLESAESSTWQELIAVRNSLLSFNRHGELRGMHILIVSDSQAACAILTKARAHSARCHSACQAVWFYCIQHDITLTAEWVPREKNTVADFFSKMRDGSDWSLDTFFFNNLARRWGPFDWDLFASEHNSRARNFFSLHHSPSSSGINGLAQDWGRIRNAWCHPPFYLIADVIRHALRCKSRMCLIVPAWPGAAWWPLLLQSPNVFTWFVKEAQCLAGTPGHPLFLAGASNVENRNTNFHIPSAFALRLDCSLNQPWHAPVPVPLTDGPHVQTRLR